MANDWHDALRSLLPDDHQPDTVDDEVETPSDDYSSCPRLDIILERKGRGGKTATIVSGFTLDDEALRSVAARLKSALGTGGSARGGEILIQGDRRSDVLRLLSDMGFRARII
jgi:translation initiation factor 1